MMMRQSRIPLLCLYFASSSSSSASAFVPTASASAASRALLPRLSSPAFGRNNALAPRSIDVATKRAMSSPSSSDAKDAAAAGGLSDIGRSNAGGGGKPFKDESESSSWRERIGSSVARSRKVRGGNYVQIATVDPNTGEPRCRTVVFRGFLRGAEKEEDAGDDVNEDGRTVLGGEPTVMKMITDLRSSKVGEASGGTADEATTTTAAMPTNAEMVWWFGKSSEQYRIRGNLKFVGGGTFDDDDDVHLSRARKEQWGNLSDTAREQFYWKEPGVPYVQQATVPPGGRGDDGRVLPPPENFLLMLLYPNRVDYLRLGDNFRQVDELDREGGGWKLERVNP
uniref:Pyridoxamine 5'-phosphate oxidase Alr4036 family FMN-binding domain-containing protein n=1 Tax=Odontella aurita TaxID=265563 RepID=A0A7S4IHW8_9STRA|mmetsp:Transcript_25399/g.74768  ORF Transcript_25399/g.74768 Transcript_25399/m.74768 type:complete len:339 (+) Transcript_25399:127-1143(+)